MAYLSDTNILLRLAVPHDPQHALVVAAIDRLEEQGEDIYIAPQNIIEFWNTATPPRDKNGFGYTPAQADTAVSNLEAYFLLVPDVRQIYDEWRRLVLENGVSGVQVHDARLVAVMHIHRLTHILTLNTADFKRYAGIMAVHPHDIVI